MVEHVVRGLGEVVAEVTQAGGFTPYAMFWLRHDVVQWLSPQMPQMRLVMKCVSRGSIPFMKMSNPRKIIEVE